MPHRKPVFTVSTLHKQLRDEMYRRIRNKEWRSGDQLPSEISLAEEFGVSVGTVRRVLDDLVQNHVVERRKGRGTYVTAADKEMLEWRFYRLRPAGGRVLTVKSQEVGRRAATGHESEQLRIPPGTPVVFIRRLRDIDDTPVMVESITIPAAYVSGLDTDDIPIFILSHYLDRYGVVIHRSEEKISAEIAEESLASQLQVEAGSPILRLERVLFDSTGRVFEWRLRRCTPAAGYYFATVGEQPAEARDVKQIPRFA